MTAGPMPRRRQRPEMAIQADIVGYLRAVLPPRDAFCYANANAAIRTTTGKAGNAVPGLTSGIPDLMIIASGGKAFYIEVKTGEGKLSAAQDSLLLRFVTMGVPYVVARSIDDVKAALSHWGIKTRETAPLSQAEAFL